MTFHRFSIIIILLIASTVSIARSPAVDPMVGIEPENYREIKSNEAFAFDFRNPTLERGPAYNQSKAGKSDSSSFAYFVLFGFLTLPFLMWYFIGRKALNEYSQKHEQALNSNNVTSLKGFKEQKDTSSNMEEVSEEDYRDKAS